MTKKYNEKNERVKTKYFEKKARSRDPKTIDSYVKAIYEFETSTGFADFKTFNSDQAIEFKAYLNNKNNKNTGHPISKSYFVNYLSHVKMFFLWLKDQKGYRRHIDIDDVLDFDVNRNDRRRASATNYKEHYEVSDILSAIRSISSDDLLSRRNKAMISLCLLTTPRVSALRTTRIDSIKHFKEYKVYGFVQDPRYIDTKYAHNFIAYFIGDVPDIVDAVVSWQQFLLEQGFDSKDPLFPKIQPSFDEGGRQVFKVEKQIIKSAETIRRVFKSVFTSSGLPYYSPHSFRHTIIGKALRTSNSDLFLSALGPNFGHALPLPTLISSYGVCPERERAKVLKSFELE
tara:strand:- start:738 stop:1769 length:1032 start_codon:yes stop_codon:yes gene_type:complete